jgi:hypothetical protein
MRIVTFGVALADTAVAPVDEKLGPLVAGDLPGRINGFPLRVVQRGRALAAGTSDRPSVLMRDNMLVASGHHNILFLLVFFQSLSESQKV